MGAVSNSRSLWLRDRRVLTPSNKPAGSNLQINWGHPLAQNLIWYTLFDENLTVYEGRDLVIPTWTTSGTAMSGEPHGEAYSLTANGSYFYSDDAYVDGIIGGGSEITFFAHITPISNGGASSYIFGDVSATASQSFWGLYYHQSSNSYLALLRNGSTTVVSTTQGRFPVQNNVSVCLVATYEGSELRLFVNGDGIGTAAQTGTIRTFDTCHIAFNRWNNAGSFRASFHSAGVMNVALNDEDARSLSFDPYQFIG